MKTVSLELSRQLKENGYPQGTYFHWQRREEPFSNTWITIHTDFKEDNSLIAAPTADEILNQLPITFIGATTFLPLTIEIYTSVSVSGKSICIRYGSVETEVKRPHICANESLTDAAAKMWLYLKKERLLENPYLLSSDDNT